MTRSEECVLGSTIVREQIETAIREVLSPLFEADGASLELVEVEDRVVRLRFGGNYRGCPSVPYTLEGVVLPALRRAAGPDIQVEVVP
jgi:Fe-S cluster biogenesis protein NfuA